MGSTWASAGVGGSGGGTWATGGGGAGNGLMDSDLLDQEQLQKALDAAKKSNSGGFFGKLKSLGSTALGDVTGGVAEGLHVLDKARAAAVATGHQIGLAAREVAGKAQPGDERASLGNWLNEVNHNISAGQVLQQGGYGAGPGINVFGHRLDARGAAGFGLDLAADPLNAVAPGRDEVANAGLRATGAVLEGGDAAARSLLREGGLDALRGEVERQTGRPLEDVIAAGTTEGLGEKGTQDVVQERLAALDQQAKGGLRVNIPGVKGITSTGIGQEFADNTLGKITESPVLKAARAVFQPSAPVLEATRSKALASGFQDALHERGIAMRVAKATMGDAAAETEEGKAAIEAAGRKAMTDTLAQRAPALVGGAPEDGFVPLAKAGEEEPLVHPAVKQALQNLVPDKAQSDLSKLGQASMGKLKQYTVFGPQNAVQHDAKRMFTNSILGTTHGEGIKSALSAIIPGVGSEAKDIYNAAQDIAKSGAELTPEEFAARGLSDQAAKRAAAIAPAIFQDNPLYEVGDNTAKGALGTRTAAHIAERNGTINRLGVALNALDQGADPLEATAQARKAMLDFSNEGLTKSEKKLEKGVFFYKFPRRIIPSAVEFAAQHPGEADVMTRLGLGVGTGGRNQYGEVTHLMPDTPLEAGFGDINEAVTNPLGFATGNINPVLGEALKYAATGKGDVVKAIPPLSQLKSLGGTLSTVKGAEGYAPKLVGLTPGQDYEAAAAAKKESAAEAKAQKSAADRKAAGLQPTKRDRLTALAKKYGIPNPYSTSEAKILLAAVQKGAKSKDLLNTLQG